MGPPGEHVASGSGLYCAPFTLTCQNPNGFPSSGCTTIENPGYESNPPGVFILYNPLEILDIRHYLLYAEHVST